MGIRMAAPWKEPSGIYYLRRKVPADIAARATGQTVALTINGKTVTCKLGQFAKASLGTREPTTAKERLREAEGTLEAWFKALREGPSPLSQRQTEALAGLAYAAFADAFSENPGTEGRWLGVLVANLRADHGDP